MAVLPGESTQHESDCVLLGEEVMPQILNADEFQGDETCTQGCIFSCLQVLLLPHILLSFVTLFSSGSIKHFFMCQSFSHRYKGCPTALKCGV
jgi:hypothetical protein